MTFFSVLKEHTVNLYFPAQCASLDATSQTGNWLLETGRAITVMSRSGGQLQVARGQVWATLGSDNPQPWRAAPLEPCATLKDYFLSAGDTLLVPPGARVVIESTGRAQSLPVAFAWGHAAQPARLSKVEVVQAAGELQLALVQVLRAARRLVGAVVLGPKPEERLETCL
jgi:Protein of unknown function (DUF2917)